MNFKNELFTDLSIGRLLNTTGQPRYHRCVARHASQKLLENVTVVEKYFWASQRFAYMNILVHENGAPFMWKQWKAEAYVIRKILF